MTPMKLSFRTDTGIGGNSQFIYAPSGSLFIRLSKDDGRALVVRLHDEQVSQLAEMLVAGLTNNGDSELKE